MHPNNDNFQSLASNQVTHIIEDSDGDIWVATSNGIGCYHTRTGQWTTLLSSQEEGRQDQNYVYISLCESTPGTILVGGYMSGMYRINKKDMRPQYFSPQAEGYTVNLLFFWLESPEMAVQRVAKRVKEGGHDIPEDVIYRRYKLGICNFFNLYKDAVDMWTLVDNASSPRRVIATDEEIKDIELYNKIEAYVNN